MKGLIGIAIGILLAIAVFLINHLCFNMQFDGNSAGVLISALGVMVTALVGWQVFNAINLDSRILAIEKTTERNALYGDARICFTQEILIYTVTSSNPNIKAQIATDNYSIAYRNFLESLIKHQSSKRESKPIQSCCVNLDKCIKKIEEANATFHKSTYEKCDELYNDFLFKENELCISREILTKLANLHERRLRLQPNN